MADLLGEVMSDRQEYAQFVHRARGRVTNFFQLDDVLASYHQLYKELGNLPDSVSFDFRKVNQDAMDLIHAEMGARDEALCGGVPTRPTSSPSTPSTTKSAVLPR